MVITFVTVRADLNTRKVPTGWLRHMARQSGTLFTDWDYTCHNINITILIIFSSKYFYFSRAMVREQTSLSFPPPDLRADLQHSWRWVKRVALCITVWQWSTSSLSLIRCSVHSRDLLHDGSTNLPTWLQYLDGSLGKIETRRTIAIEISAIFRTCSVELLP